MKTTNFKRQCIAQVTGRLQQIATGYAAIYGYNVINRDMAVSIASFSKCLAELDYELNTPYYFAIREMGVEDGTRREVDERCKVLGEPVCIIKVDGTGRNEFDVTIEIK